MTDAITLGYIKVSCDETDICINSIRSIDDDSLEEAKVKVDIVIRKKQIDADIKIYYPIIIKLTWLLGWTQDTKHW